MHTRSHAVPLRQEARNHDHALRGADAATSHQPPSTGADCAVTPERLPLRGAPRRALHPTTAGLTTGCVHMGPQHERARVKAEIQKGRSTRELGSRQPQHEH